MFSLFAPTIAEGWRIGSFSNWKDIKMDRQSNRKYEYKFRIQRREDDWFDVIDPCITV